MLPGPDIQIVDAALSPGALTDTGTAFMVGLADRGPTSGQLAPGDALTSLAGWVTKHGARQAYNGVEYDAVETFFAEGGSRLYYSRKVGLAAVKAAANVPVASSKFSATAKSPGAWANGATGGLSVGVASSVVTVYENGVAVEVSPVLADATAAATWSAASSTRVDLAQLAAGALTDSAPVNLAGGADDRASITDTQIQAALDRFGKDLGPGQVSLPGDVRIQALTMLATHARDRNRFAYGDLPDTPTVGTLTGLAASVRALGRELARHIQLFDQWAVIPGTTPGTTRLVPWSAVQSGLAARVDRGGNPNMAIAGPARGNSQFATALKYVRTDTEREQLADAGVTAIVSRDGAIQAYDDVTPVDPVAEPEWVGAAGNRAIMAIVVDALKVASSHLFAQNDGPASLTDFGGDLVGMLSEWRRRRALFSLDGTADSAFRVDTGPSVNTPATTQARQLRSRLALRVSPNNRQVIVQITNVPLTTEVL